jgi:hypothetical protein
VSTAERRSAGPQPLPPICEQHASCPACSDAAVAMRVLALAPPLAPARCIAADGSEELVLLDLVDARVGDEVLVHGGVAIALTRSERP